MRFAIMTFAASMAFGQTNREFQLTQKENQQDMAEIATVLRATAGLERVSIDETKGTLAVEGTAPQITMADWLVQQLDLPAKGPFAGVHEYRGPSGGDDVLRVFYLRHAETPRDVQEIATTVRSVTDIQRIFVYNARRALALRGNNYRIMLAAWLVDQIDQPAKVAAPEPHEYKLAGDDVARVFELTNAETTQQLQEMVTLIRSVADVQRMFVCTTRRTLAVRATGERVALAAWLVNELDKPAGGQAGAQDSTPEYRLTNDPDNLVRVFYLAGHESAEDRQKVVEQVRANTGIRRVFLYNALGLVAVRGTAGQVATAEKAIEEMK